MKKNAIKYLSVFGIGLMLLTGCTSNETQKSEGQTETSPSEEESTLTVTDAEGEKVEVNKDPKKVVVFDMGSLDTIQALGKGESVVGVPQKNVPSYLEEFADVESAGGIKEPDLEKINEMQPDLIIISGRQQDSAEKLKMIAPTLYLETDGEDNWGSIRKNIETIGKIYGMEKQAQEKTDKLKENIDTTKKKVEKSRQKALVILVNEGQMSAYGSGSRFGIIHDTFGFPQADENIEVSTHGQSVSYEYILEENPDVLFIVDRTKAIGGDDSKNNIEDNELIKQTNAAKNNKIITLAADVWYLSGGGLESTELMLKDVESALK